MKLFTTVRMIFDAVIKPKQHISIREIPAGTVLDIGGGGEGVIARVGGAAVVAVDKYLSEIDEAREKAAGAAWLVADATALPFKSQSLDHATAFFSCMYMPNEVKEKVFRETRRALKEGGEFWIWDTPISLKNQVFAIRLQVDLRDAERINTTYGVKAKDQSAASISSLLRQVGFEPEIITSQKHWFFIKAKSSNFA
jgi:ubiquinone/menaquinone biosynthesis C-methylase UbiE